MGCCSHELFGFCTLVPTPLFLVDVHLLDPEMKPAEWLCLRVRLSKFSPDSIFPNLSTFWNQT